MLSLNQSRIQNLINSLNAIPLPSDFRQRLMPAVTADDETAYLAFLWSTAICHATKGGLRGVMHGKTIKGHDFLLHVFYEAANQEPTSLSVTTMKRIDADGLDRLLKKYAEQSEIKLSDLDRRAEILRELALAVEEKFDGHLTNLVEKANHRVAGEQGFYALMSTLPGFQDELKKKSGVMLMCLDLSGRWSVEDPDEIIPMIDYHKLRIFLRTGCIEVEDGSLKEKLQQKVSVSADQEHQLRQACVQICQQMNKAFDNPIRGELIYQLGRSYCRNNPACVSGNQPENSSFNDVTDTVFEQVCPFQSWCPGACNTSYRSLWEPMLETENY